MVRDKEIKIDGPGEDIELTEKSEADLDENESVDNEANDQATAGAGSVEELQARCVELEDKLLRSAAEFENYKKRIIRQFENQVQFSRKQMLSELLVVMDSFERALEHAESDNTDSIRQGMEMIYKQLREYLSSNKVKAIDAVGEKFDPNLHEAMMQTPSAEYDEGTVAVEINRGYMIGDEVLRHSKVGVSTGAESSGENNDDLTEKET